MCGKREPPLGAFNSLRDPELQNHNVLVFSADEFMYLLDYSTENPFFPRSSISVGKYDEWSRGFFLFLRGHIVVACRRNLKST